MGSNGVLVGSPNYLIEPTSGGILNFNPLISVRNANIAGGNGHYVATRNQLHFVTYQNGIFTTGAPSFTPSNAKAALDTADLLIANGGTQVCCAHGGHTSLRMTWATSIRSSTTSSMR